MSNRPTDAMLTAAAAGDWPSVLRLWEQFTAGIREELARRVCTPGRLSEAREFLDWSARLALCARAQNQQRLDAIHAAQQYGPRPPHRRSVLHTSL